MIPSLLKKTPKVSTFLNLFSASYFEKFNSVYNQLGRPLPFDVTLRDGLQ